MVCAQLVIFVNDSNREQDYYINIVKKEFLILSLISSTILVIWVSVSIFTSRTVVCTLN